MNVRDGIFAAISLPILIAAAWFAIEQARADAAFQRGDPESVAHAIAIEPRNTESLLLRALQLDYAGENSIPALERAAALSPLNSAPRLRLGLAYEIRGDYATAERRLLDAARVDHQFEPRWTLANFYFRHAGTDSPPDAHAAVPSNASPPDAMHGGFWNEGGYAAGFWKWIRAALEISYGDRHPAFDLCWRMGGADEILSRAIPDQHEILSAYLAFLFDNHRDAIAPVAMKLAHFKHADDRAILLVACDFLIDGAKNNPASAARSVALWRAMGYAEPSGVFNGTFSSPILGHGFDWREADLPGVTHSRIDQPDSAHRISFDGNQPESCVLLTEIVNLEPGFRYQLKWNAETSGFASPSGLEWIIGDLHAPIAANGSLTPGHAEFTAASELQQLRLVYRRPEGEARAEGSIDLTRVAIERLP